MLARWFAPTQRPTRSRVRILQGSLTLAIVQFNGIMEEKKLTGAAQRGVEAPVYKMHSNRRLKRQPGTNQESASTGNAVPLAGLLYIELTNIVIAELRVFFYSICFRQSLNKFN